MWKVAIDYFFFTYATMEVNGCQMFDCQHSLHKNVQQNTKYCVSRTKLKGDK